jgi:hypothetical protein
MTAARCFNTPLRQTNGAAAMAAIPAIAAALDKARQTDDVLATRPLR